MYKPTRAQLSKFLPSHELVIAFERLFDAAAGDEGAVAALQSALTTLTNRVTVAEGGIDDAEVNDSVTAAQITTAIAAIDNLRNAVELHGFMPSADNTPLLDYVDFDQFQDPIERKGRIHWDIVDETLSLAMAYDVKQQIGLETYARVQNSTGVTIPNGTVVGFIGVGGSATLSAGPFIANGTVSSLYMLGVMTHDLPDSGQIGYCTVWGHVRDIDTTGTPVGETWVVGDVLYASPTTAGAFTNVKPTAPYNVIPVAAVLTVHATTGVIFVRPTIEQQKYYGETLKTTDQSPAVINTAYAITFDSIAFANGVSLGTPTSRIVVANAGLYNFAFNVQVTSNNANLKNIWTWFRKNGTDIANTSFIFTTDTNGGYTPLSRSNFFSMNAGDYIEVMFASDDTGVTLDAVAATAFAPAAPAAILSVTMVQQ